MNGSQTRFDQTRFEVPIGWSGTCGDFLRQCGVSRRLTARLKRVENGITVSGMAVRTVDIVHGGDIVAIKNIDRDSLEPNPSLAVPIAYEDESVIVFDKPAGMPVHPSHKHRGDTLGNLFAAMYPDLTFRPLNRLDKDTSGLCAAAKSTYAASVLSGNISKIYAAVTEGVPVPKDVGNPLIKWCETAAGYRIEAPIGRAEETVILREVRSDGKFAATDYTILKEDGKHALLRIALETGRTHQIRVHFSSVGHPLAGDNLYGGSRQYCSRQALHCMEMSFVSPNGKEIFLTSEIPTDMKIIFGDGK